jgi:hypothetical protein
MGTHDLRPGVAREVCKTAKHYNVGRDTAFELAGSRDHVMKAVLCLLVVGLLFGCSRPALLYKGRPLEHWRQTIKSADVKDRIEAVAALGELKHIDAIPDLTEALTDPDGAVRANAAAALWGFAANAREAAPALTASLKDKNAEVRMNAAGALGDLGANDPAVLAALCDSLRDKSPEVRGYAATSLGRLGRDAPIAIQKLANALLDRDKNVRVATLYGLAEIGPGAALALPEVKRLSKDKDGDVRTAALYAIKRVEAAE